MKIRRRCLSFVFCIVFAASPLLEFYTAHARSGEPATRQEPPATDNSRPLGLAITNEPAAPPTVTWTTAGPRAGWLRYGNAPDALTQLAFDERGEATAGKDHRVLLPPLQPGQTYYFVVISDGQPFDDAGSPFKVAAATDNPAGLSTAGAQDIAAAAANAGVNDFLTSLAAAEPNDARIAHLQLLSTTLQANTVVLNFSATARALSEFEIGELLHAVDNRVGTLATANNHTGAPPQLDYLLQVEGEPLFEIMAPQVEPMAPNSIQGKRIVLSPGHGRYDNGAGGWPLQRGYWSGIVEDFINLDLITRLYNKLGGSGVIRRPVRQLNKNAGTHAASARPWWEIAASEYVRSLGAPESVWRPDGMNGVNRDIAARPEYANWIAADAMITLHNNGGGGCNTETWYDNSNGYQVQSQRLATLIHNTIVQRLRAQWNANWGTGICNRGVKSSNGGYGENRRFRGPAVLIELAFMDNPTDNAALQNTRFQEIAMQAVRDAILEYFGGVSDTDDNRILISGKMVTGTITPTLDTDAYYFDAAQGQTATITMNRTTTSLDSYIYLYGPSVTLVGYDDDSGGTLNSRLVMTLPKTGRYRLEAKSYKQRSTGGYQLKLTLGLGGCAPGANGVVVYEHINFGGRCITFTADDPDFTNDAFNDIVSSLRLTGTYAADWEVQLFETAAYTGAVSTYRAGDSSLLDDAVGNDRASSMRIRRYAGDPDDNRTLAAGKTLIGAIDPANDFDTYYFDAAQGQVATLSMIKTVSTLDGYLALYSPGGALVGTDDDGAGHLNPNLKAMLPQTGRYRVEAQSYNQVTYGGYQLTLTLGATASTLDPWAQPDRVFMPQIEAID